MRALIVALLLLAPATLAFAATPDLTVDPAADLSILRACFFLFGTPLFGPCYGAFLTLYQLCFTVPFPLNIICFNLA
jgi:peptidoglycan/LPS O-acetylase OafA/YrhL